MTLSVVVSNNLSHFEKQALITVISAEFKCFFTNAGLGSGLAKILVNLAVTEVRVARNGSDPIVQFMFRSSIVVPRTFHQT